MYAIKLSIALSLVYLFYRVFLRGLTFYHWNRWYLVGYSFLCFFIPFINIAPAVEHKNLFATGIFSYMPALTDYAGKPKNNPVTPGISLPIHLADILPGLFLAGVMLMSLRLLFQYRAIQKIKKHASVIKTGDAIVYHIRQNIIPFSFGKAIYVNADNHTEKELEEIILHEYVHVKQRHTIDIFFAELLCIANWYNPFAWLIRHAIRQNLEFIADNDLLQKGVDKKAYQHHLLKVLGTSQYRIANNFNFSSLKKRIVMMNTFKSAKRQLLRFLFILPLLAVLLLAFRDKYKNGLTGNFSHFEEAGIIMDAVSNKALPGVIVKEIQSGLVTVTDEHGFYKLSMPVQPGKISETFQLQKDGYDKSDFEFEQPGNAKGFIHVFGLFSLDDVHKQKVMMFMGTDGPFNGNPQYADAFEMYKKTVVKTGETNAMIQFLQAHPEVNEFYTAENNKQHIVFLKNGQIEKYGYTGTQTVDDMEHKYGSLPKMMVSDEHGPYADYIVKPDEQGPSADYLDKWDKISKTAEKSFRSSNPAVPIIFPGDSRVIAVVKSGKPQVYDMDSNDPKERAAFEHLYGSLNGIVPAASNFPGHVIKMKDTVPTKTTIRRQSDTVEKPLRDTSNPAVRISPMPANAIYIVDGIEMPEGWSLEKANLKAGDVQNVSVGYYDEATKLSHGFSRKTIVRINTAREKMPLSKNTIVYDAVTPDTSVWSLKTSPLFFIDGKAVTPKEVRSMAPSKIESIQALKGEKAKKLFGKPAVNGVILIFTKQSPGTDGLPADTTTSSHKITLPL